LIVVTFVLLNTTAGGNENVVHRHVIGDTW